MKMAEIAERIKSHLSRLEQDPLTARNDRGHARFWGTNATVAGRFVKIRYVSYQGWASLSKDEALRYLNKLDTGYVGQHFQALREAPG